MKKVFIILGVLLVAVSLYASGIPQLLNYQGKLTDATGVAMNGNHDITFRIYDEASGVAPALWEEAHTGASAINVVNGLFDVQLGTITAFTIAFDDTYWVELVIGTETLAPRERLVAVPYAFRAIVADTAITVGSGAVQTDGITTEGDGTVATPIKVKDAGITETQLNSSVAGDGLTGGGGSALAIGASGADDDNANDIAVRVDATTIEIDGSDNLHVLGAAPTGPAGGQLSGTYPDPNINSSVAGDGLTGGDGSPIDVDPGNGIQITADQVEAKPADGTINVDSNGIRQGNGAIKTESPSYKIYRNY